MPDALPPPITRALPDLNAWATRFLALPIPVLPETSEAIESLRANEDAVDAHLVADIIGVDPLMNLKLLAHVAHLGSTRQVTTPETVTAALVWLGIGPFFRAFDMQPSVDQVLVDQAEALAGLHQVLQRAHRASAFALAFAVHRMDSDAPVIHAAALLHDFAEMLLWLHAPALALQIAQAQRTDPALRSAVVQQQVLNIELNDLQQMLMRAWKLPELLVRINDRRHADSPAVRNVLLAVRLARHSALNWDNAALGDDVRDIATLLNLSEVPTQRLLRDIDA